MKSLFNQEVINICKDFYQEASDNGTKLVYYGDERDLPLIDCGITSFITIKQNSDSFRNYPSLYEDFNYDNLETMYKWSEGRINGGWGHFEVNLDKKRILKFQQDLEEIFSKPHLYYK